MEELANLVPKKVEEDRKLNPDDIKTTILAELFQFYENECTMNHMIDQNPFCKKMNDYLRKMGNVKLLCFLIIVWSFIDQQPGWCRHALHENQFDNIVSHYLNFF